MMSKENLAKLITEGRNTNTINIDKADTLTIIELINEEDKKVALAVEKVKESIAKAVDCIYEKLSTGGRLIYIGAGTSGRLGVIDASECPPTFGVDFEMVQGIIAGGYEAMFKSVEDAEDSEEGGKNDLIDKKLTSMDVVCGIAASGRTPYVIGAMKYAKEIGAAVICITANQEGKMNEIADISIGVDVGPEVINGSTRMKAGTAQKLVLNILSTATMIKLGKVYGNLMVDVQATNEKLIDRAKRIVCLATGVKETLATEYLFKTDFNVKLSILMIKENLDIETAIELLEKNNGFLQKALDYVDNIKC